MKTFSLFLIGILSILNASAQGVFQIGFGIQQNKFSGQQYTIDSLAIAPRTTFDDPRLTILLLYNQKVSNRINLEAGLRFYTIFNTYYAGQLHPDFGYIQKVGFVKSNTFNIPINLEYHLRQQLYVKAGISASLAILKKSEDLSFNDTPAVDDLYNEAKHIFRPAFLSYGLGVGYRLWRFDLSYYYTKSFTDISNPLEYSGDSFMVFRSLETHQLEITYFFQSRK